MPGKYFHGTSSGATLCKSLSDLSGFRGFDLSKRKPYLLLGLGIVVVDQATKLIALQTLGLEGREITVIPNVLWLYVIKNTGAAFGMFQSLGWLLAAISVMLIYAGWKILHHEEDPALLIALASVLGGAAGNLVDRVFRGGVIDFLKVPNWPLFNIADCAITLGAIGILYYGMTRRRDGPAPLESVQNAPDSD